jgi:hypothetical protein
LYRNYLTTAVGTEAVEQHDGFLRKLFNPKAVIDRRGILKAEATYKPIREKNMEKVLLITRRQYAHLHN